MNANVFFPSQPHWTAQELAEAVPLRLHELFAFDAGRNGVFADSANSHLHPGHGRGAQLPAGDAGAGRASASADAIALRPLHIRTEESPPCSTCARSPRSTAPNSSKPTRCARCDLHVREGEFVAVTGPSGSGKTTFLNIAGLLETFTGGEYKLDGEDVRGLSDDARSQAAQPEDRLHLPELQPDPRPRTCSTTSTCRCAIAA